VSPPAAGEADPPHGPVSGRPTVSHGAVTAFDPQVGLGTVRAGDGTEVRFHCTQIADGSRDIAVGTAVAFEVVAGRHGRWEAGQIRPSPPPDGVPGQDGRAPG